MTKEVYKYPYNVRREDEIKVFLSDQIDEQFVKKLSSKVNRKSKRVIVVITLISTL